MSEKTASVGGEILALTTQSVVESKADLTIHEIAHAEAVRALSEQHSAIDSLRTRAGLLLSSAAVTTSFLGGQAIHGGRVGVIAWLALVDFAAVAALVIATLRPRRWELSARPDETAGARPAASGAGSAAELYEELTVQLRRSHVKNRVALGQLAVLLQLVGSLLALDVIAWIVAIAASA